jgi:3-hydroxyisobutyrate dehydrogenase
MAPSNKKLGYVGLGTMGSRMAANLLKAGHKVTVWNRDRAKSDTLAARGAVVAESLEALARSGCEAVFLNLSNGTVVSDVLFGKGGLATSLVAGTVVIDNSTIAPQEAQKIAAKLKERGVDFLDAPVSGGPPGAEQATLSIMVGGDEAVFHRCLPLFQAIGKTITHLGPVGTGQACKACNQAACACNLMGVCEMLALAKKLGLDLAKVATVIGAGAGGSSQLQLQGPKILSDNMNPGFMIDLMLKDLGIIRQAAESVELSLTGTAVAEDYLRKVAASGGGRLGTQAMSQALEQLGRFRFTDTKEK